MPPFGLYQIPRHHAYTTGGSARRPTFNAKDFAEATEDEIPTSAQRDNRANEHVIGAEKKRKRKSKTPGRGDETGTAKMAGAPRTPASLNAKAKRTKKERKNEVVSAPPKLRDTKRKRDRDVKKTQAASTTASAPSKDDTTGSFLIGVDLVKSLETVMSGIGKRFDQNVKGPERKTAPAVKKQKKSTVKESTAVENPVSLYQTPARSSPLEQKNQRKRKGDVSEDQSKNDFVQNASFHPKKSVVPLPPPATSSAFSAMLERHQNTNKPKEAVGNPEVIIPETPPSRATTASYTAVKSPVRLPPKLLPNPMTNPPKLSKRQRLTQYLSSSSSSNGEDGPSSSAPAAMQQNQMRRKSTGATHLTPATTKKITQPLSDEPKPRPRAKASAKASDTSLPSSRASSVSIPDMFNRISKADARSEVATDPFTTPIPQKPNPKPRSTYNEATNSMSIFNTKFHELQKHVDFPAEQEYVNQHLDWQTDNTSSFPFPCLGQLSGCNPKKEEILRLSKEENLNIRKAIAITGGDDSTLQDASHRAQKAEDFLKLSIRASVPVPIGRLEGKWKLYSPKYSVHHFDKYGYGGRTMTISSIAGFKDKNQFTARLSIPPRSMMYSILTFAAPPHASFRTTVIKTAPEGYRMDVVFLGNGYLHLRVDLNLLLKGKPTEAVGGKKVWMEFVGVHEEAVEWVEMEEGKRVLAKDG